MQPTRGNDKSTGAAQIEEFEEFGGQLDAIKVERFEPACIRYGQEGAVVFGRDNNTRAFHDLNLADKAASEHAWEIATESPGLLGKIISPTMNRYQHCSANLRGVGRSLTQKLISGSPKYHLKAQETLHISLDQPADSMLHSGVAGTSVSKQPNQSFAAESLKKLRYLHRRNASSPSPPPGTDGGEQRRTSAISHFELPPPSQPIPIPKPRRVVNY